MRTALDTNVLSALLSQEPLATEISEVLSKVQVDGGLTICAPVYVELYAYPNATPDFLNHFLRITNITVDFLLTEDVWHLAAEAFSQYAERRRRSKGKNPKRLLADFIIGAHAMLRADRLFTLDKGPYEHSFPKLKLLS
jgi:predicted nucleic acid-binding protein